MIQTEDANIEHIAKIKKIVDKTWAITYNHILSKEQIDYMLDMMYSDSALLEQMTVLQHQFILVKRAQSKIFEGFVSFEFNFKNENRTKLHKLYISPQSQGCGLGRVLIHSVYQRAKEYGNKSVILNMNRSNKALGFYKNIGFEIIGEEDIDIGKGYLMEDYILEKEIKQ